MRRVVALAAAILFVAGAAQGAQIRTDRLQEGAFSLEYPVVSGQGNAVRNVNREVERFLGSVRQEFSQQARPECSGELSFRTMRQDNLLSFFFSQFVSCTDAAHPSQYQAALTFDARSGKRLHLRDLFLAEGDWQGALDDEINRQIADRGLEENMLEPFRGVPEDYEQFYLTKNALVIFWEDYEYTPHAVGPQEFKISLSRLRSLLDPRLITR